MNALLATAASPFHAGEKEMQSRIGKREEMERIGQTYIRAFMPGQHREFFAKLPSIVLGSVDPDGWPWASMLSGRPGFMATPHDTRLDIHAGPLAGDPLAAALRPGAPIGVVGVELPTRRRNRMNATVGSADDGRIQLDVVQSFGNCPQYIQTHDVAFVREPDAPVERAPAEHLTALDVAARETIVVANTFYVASYASVVEPRASCGVDVSHRGGRPGFVKIEGDTLLVPDFSGNNFFNTIGNFLLNPKAGLLFPDYATGDLLMLTGRVEVLDEHAPEIAAFLGADRAWRFTLDHGIRLHDALPFRADLLAYSPNSLMAHDWATSEARAQAEADRNVWRTLRVSAVEDASEVIRSFTFEPVGTLPLPSFEAGQFLTLRTTPAEGPPQTRTYTISSAPGDAGYRISVKREPGGLVSGHLHETLRVGDLVEVKAPKGRLRLDASETRPAVLFAGGIGITPMISMVRHALNEGVRVRHTRPLTLFYAARTVAERAFHADLREAAKLSGGKIRYVSIIERPEESAQSGVDYDVRGYVTQDLIRRTLALDAYDFFLCGTAPFMQAVYNMLRGLDVADARIFAERFGPASLNRHGHDAVPTPEAVSARVIFQSSGLEARWEKGGETLLELAEAQGITPVFSCRTGTCGSCRTRKLAGQVTYRTAPTADRSEEEVLICCAVPAEDDGTVVLDL